MATKINLEVDGQRHIFDFLIFHFGKAADPTKQAYGFVFRNGVKHSFFQLKIPGSVKFEDITARKLLWFTAKSAIKNDHDKALWDAVTDLSPEKVMDALETAIETGEIYSHEKAKILYGQNRIPTTIIRKRKKSMKEDQLLPGLFDQLGEDNL